MAAPTRPPPQSRHPRPTSTPQHQPRRRHLRQHRLRGRPLRPPSSRLAAARAPPQGSVGCGRRGRPV
eukprot:3239095-Prymnesium_polylepis.1